jgi:hypothetical protein
MPATYITTSSIATPLVITKGQVSRFVFNQNSLVNNEDIAFLDETSISNKFSINSVSSKDSDGNLIRSYTFGNVSVPSNLAVNDYTITVTFRRVVPGTPASVSGTGAVIPATSDSNADVTTTLYLKVIATFNVALDGYTNLTPAFGSNTASSFFISPAILNWRPLSLTNSPAFFGASTTMSCLFSGQSYLSRDRDDYLQTQIDRIRFSNDTALNNLSTQSTLYLKDFTNEFNAFKGQITAGLATALSELALDDIQSNLLSSAVSQLSSIDGSIFSAIAQKASLMTENLTLAYTRNFVNVLLSVYPINNTAGGADNGVCNVNDFFPEVYWGSSVPNTSNEVSYAEGNPNPVGGDPSVGSDAYATMNVTTQSIATISGPGGVTSQVNAANAVADQAHSGAIERNAAAAANNSVEVVDGVGTSFTQPVRANGVENATI